MARRREPGAEAFYHILTGAPVWVGPVCAIGMFALLRFLIPAWLLGSAGPNDPTSIFGRVLEPLSAALAPWAALLIILIWLAAECKKLMDRRRLDRQTGLDSIRSLSWSAFEELIAEYYRRAGYAVERTGGAAPDGGVDIVLRRDGLVTLVQCKHWKDRTVGVKIVRELRGVMTSEKADHGIVVGSGTFSGGAIAFAEKNRVTLVAGEQLAAMIHSVQTNQAAPSPAPVGAANSIPIPAQGAPSCPRCGAPMVQRIARRGPHAGSPFWGCPRYPACQGTRPADTGPTTCAEQARTRSSPSTRTR